MSGGQQFSFNLGLGATPETKDKENYAELARIYSAIRNVAYAVDSNTGSALVSAEDYPQLTPSLSVKSQNQNKIYVQFTGSVPVGGTVSLYNSGAILKGRPANAGAAGTLARGFLSSLFAVNSGDWGEVVLNGLNPYMAGLTPGALYYQSNTNSLVSTTAGTVSQPVGIALSTTDLYFKPNLA